MVWWNSLQPLTWRKRLYKFDSQLTKNMSPDFIRTHQESVLVPFGRFWGCVNSVSEVAEGQKVGAGDEEGWRRMRRGEQGRREKGTVEEVRDNKQIREFCTYFTGALA